MLGDNAYNNGLDSEYQVAVFNETENLLAVEVHQVTPGSSDLSFDLELREGGVLGGQSAVIRGPYLQMGTATNVVVRWRTAFPRISLVRYGTSRDPATWSRGSTRKATGDGAAASMKKAGSSRIRPWMLGTRRA